MASERTMTRDNDPLIRARRRANYNAAEQQFSLVLQQRLHKLLEGKINVLELLRRYPHQPNRLGVMVTPPGIPRDQLRLPVMAEMAWEAIDFVRLDSVGGPVAQHPTPDGSVIERQIFSTRYPHIVIERTDRYIGTEVDPVETTWCLRRVQNQRSQTQLNRILDAANLAFELLRAIR
jgi:hypothetical protein